MGLKLSSGPLILGRGGGLQIKASSFSPLSLTPVFWAEADTGTSTTTDGVAVSQWNDQSGNARHAVQATVANQPVYKASGGATFNNKPVIRFDGAGNPNGDNLASTFGITLTQPSTIVVVGSYAVTSEGRYYCDGIVTGNRHAIASGFGGAGKLGLYAGGTDFGSLLTFPTAASVYSAVFNGASSVLYRNGTSLTTGNPGTHTLTGLTIGGRFASGDGGLNGDIAAVIVVNAALTTTQRQNLERYWGAKYGITVA